MKTIKLTDRELKLIRETLNEKLAGPIEGFTEGGAINNRREEHRAERLARVAEELIKKLSVLVLVLALALTACGGVDPVKLIKKEIKNTVDDALPYTASYDPWECATIYVNKNNPTACTCEAHPGCIVQAATYDWPARGCFIYDRCAVMAIPTHEVDFYSNFPDPEGL